MVPRDADPQRCSPWFKRMSRCLVSWPNSKKVPYDAHLFTFLYEVENMVVALKLSFRHLNLCIILYPRGAENLLADKPIGCFLIRISESKFGYSLSYRLVFGIQILRVGSG